MNYNIQNHLKEFPNSAIQEVGGRLYGCFIIGNNYKRKNRFHGEYPPNYLNRITSLFPDSLRKLHLFSGTLEMQLPKTHTFDSNLDLHPTTCGNAEYLSAYFESTLTKFDLIVADPPYSKNDCDIYGCKMPNKRKVIKECREVILPGGWLVWLDLITPIWSKEDWELKGLIQLWCGSNRKVRTVTLFQATEK